MNRLIADHDGELNAFVKIANDCAKASLLERDTISELAKKIDFIWFSLILGKVVDSSTPVTAIILFMNGHRMFRASLLNSWSGFSTAVYPLLRSSVESCLYSFHTLQDPKAAAAWSVREESVEKRKVCISHFSPSKMLDELTGIDEDLGLFVRNLYEATIDFGAHPNVRSVAENLTFTTYPEGTGVSLDYLSRNVEAERAILACAETGCAMPHFAKYIVPKKLEDLSLEAAINEVSAGIQRIQTEALD